MYSQIYVIIKNLSCLYTQKSFRRLKKVGVNMNLPPLRMQITKKPIWRPKWSSMPPKSWRTATFKKKQKNNWLIINFQGLGYKTTHCTVPHLRAMLSARWNLLYNQDQKFGIPIRNFWYISVTQTWPVDDILTKIFMPWVSTKTYGFLELTSSKRFFLMKEILV